MEGGPWGGALCLRGAGYFWREWSGAGGSSSESMSTCPRVLSERRRRAQKAPGGWGGTTGAW
jgi:hypothetical protein